MHTYGITRKDLAEAVDMNPKYIGMILNGKRNPKNGEAVVRFALAKAIAKKGDG
jgi:transcriptional regulator with XRE-family HTH domain